MRIVEGLPELSEQGPALSRLLIASGAPITAQWWWLERWAATHPGWRPRGLLVPDGGGELAAAALLAHRRRGVLTEVMPLGFGQSDYSWLPALDSSASTALAHALADSLTAIRGPWRLYLNELPRGDPVAEKLRALLALSSEEPGAGAAVIDLHPGFDPGSDLRASARRPARAGRNRIASDGRQLTVVNCADPQRIAALLPEIERVHRSRDRLLRGRSDLDDPSHRSFFYSIISTAAARGVADVTVLVIDGQIGAHLVGFVDGEVLRVWDTRLAPGYERYNLGHLIRDEVLTRLVATGRFTKFDWMRGTEDFKLRTASSVVATSTLRAWSSASVAFGERVVRSGRHRWASLRRPDPAAS